MFIINGIHKYAEQDNYTEGCGGKYSDTFIDIRLTDATLPGLLSKFADMVCVPVADLDLDACEEIGRIDAQRTENDSGDEPTVREESEFKDGKRDLWLATYTAYAYESTPVSVA